MLRKVIQCDRCNTSEWEGAVDRSQWARAFAATLSGADEVGSSEVPADLCGTCLKDFRDFMRGKATAALEGER